MTANTSRFCAASMKFRQKYSLPKDADTKKWFPRHMFSGLQHMRAKIRAVDAVVEVHDARIPFTGRNPLFKRELYNVAKPHILVLNKKDLVAKNTRTTVDGLLKRNDPELRRILWTDCKRSQIEDMRTLMDIVREVVTSVPRYNREYVSEYTLMIIGIPNVGKSSLINALRCNTLKSAGKATAVGGKPGVTKSVLNKIIVSERPKIFLIDTPGVLPPNITDDESAMKLALCETVDQSMAGLERIADYLLYFLNKRKNFSYVDVFRLDEPCDDIYKLLFQVCLAENIVLKQGGQIRPNITSGAERFLQLFRAGKFGKDQFIDWDVTTTIPGPNLQEWSVN